MSKSGGYELMFTEEVPERYVCQICARPFRDPHLTVCCGKHYCESCLSEWFTRGSHRSCPHCRAVGKEFTHFLNKGLRSEINELKVRCSHHKLGCEWIGELGALQCHLESERDGGCEFATIVCPNRCKSERGEALHLRRENLQHHLNTQCVLRQYQCQECHLMDTYQCIVFTHYSQCPEYPIPCPNDCGLTRIKRKEMDDHRYNCPLERVECPFVEVGCREDVTRYRYGDHMTLNVEQHLLMMMEAYKSLKNDYWELKRMINLDPPSQLHSERARRH